MDAGTAGGRNDAPGHRALARRPPHRAARRAAVAPALARAGIAAGDVRGAAIRTVGRRAKYLLVETDAGTMIWHLGMSGSLRVMPADAPPLAQITSTSCSIPGAACASTIRAASAACCSRRPNRRATSFSPGLRPSRCRATSTPDALWKLARGRKASIKAFIMDARSVVGVGNIYASEALFRAGIRPGTAAGRVSRARMAALVAAIRAVLSEAIEVGGTTLRDYVDADGAPGYFARKLFVYERRGKPCRRCRTPIRQFTQGSRSTYWCPRCQR